MELTEGDGMPETTTELPAPLTPDDCNCTDLDGFMLNVERLMASELVALSTHETIGAALLLWCRAWKQTPAASLPDDDRTNAAFARLPLTRFKKIKDEVMRGFVKCSDGRLYHRTLASEAGRAFERKQAFRKKRETDAERLRKWRNGERETPNETPGETEPETPDETQSETRFVAEGQGQGQGRDREKKNSPKPPKGDSTRFDEFWEMFPKDRRDGREKCRKVWASKGLEAIADDVIAGLKRWLASEDWAKDGGKFIKGTIAWLNAGKWEAFPKPAAPSEFTIVRPSIEEIQAELARDE